jgi:tetrapyrrole methylase family protein / MazG family protein
LTGARSSFADLVAILHRLRSPGGCPWDAEQTHQSLRPYLIEEAYEVLEALDADDDRELRDELGDLLLQVVFHSELAAERGAFTIDDVVDAICSKLVRRHPHVFADVSVESSADVARNWTAIKRQERAERGNADSSAIDGVPRSLPALTRAHRIGEKASSVGFDWPGADDAREKVREELAEADAAAGSGDPDALSEEIGDLLFAVVSWSRLSGIHAEVALEKALGKFADRFRALEKQVRARGKEVAGSTPEELDAVWRDVKRLATS